MTVNANFPQPQDDNSSFDGEDHSSWMTEEDRKLVLEISRQYDERVRAWQERQERIAQGLPVAPLKPPIIFETADDILGDAFEEDEDPIDDSSIDRK